MNKVFIPLLNRPLIAHAIIALDACPQIDHMIVVAAEHELKKMSKVLVDTRIKKGWQVVAGGSERQYSIANALKAVACNTDIILVHDGARALIEPHLVTRVISVALQHHAAVLAMPVKDTIKTVNEDGCIIGAPAPRHMLWAMQTPQAFQAELLIKAYELAAQDGFLGTDDAALVERLGVSIKIVHGSYRNIKVTSPEDLMLAEMLISKGKEIGGI